MGKPALARGLGRSYGDASLNSGKRVLLMERLDRLLSFDPESGIVRAEAGLSLQKLLDYFVPKGWFPPVVPNTKFVTLGGCVAADIHGRNHRRAGSFGNHIEELELLMADGSRCICSSKQRPDLFWASIGGMGLTGIIISVSFKLIPIPSDVMRVRYQAAHNLDHLLQLLVEGGLDDQYRLAWIDPHARGRNLGRGIVRLAHHAQADEFDDLTKPRNSRLPIIPFFLPSFCLNRFTSSQFSAAYYRIQSKKFWSFLRPYASDFFPFDGFSSWNWVYGKKGFFHYQCLIPPEEALSNMERILTCLNEYGKISFRTALKRLGPHNHAPLSFPGEGYSFSIDIPRKAHAEELIGRLNRIVSKAGGRVYLAKDAYLKPEEFRDMYPHFSDWWEVKSKYDPQNLFTSDLAQRLRFGEF